MMDSRSQAWLPMNHAHILHALCNKNKFKKYNLNIFLLEAPILNFSLPHLSLTRDLTHRLYALSKNLLFSNIVFHKLFSNIEFHK